MLFREKAKQSDRRKKFVNTGVIGHGFDTCLMQRLQIHLSSTWALYRSLHLLESKGFLHGSYRLC